MTLYYGLVGSLTVEQFTANTRNLGLPFACDRDGDFLSLDSPVALHMAPKDVHLHLRESSHSQATIWFEGLFACPTAMLELILLDYLHLHPDPVH
jgi:hypothetical protein